MTEEQDKGKCEYLSLKLVGDEEGCPICTLSDNQCPYFYDNTQYKCDDYFGEEDE